jgi:anti-anti-sigma factor
MTGCGPLTVSLQISSRGQLLVVRGEVDMATAPQLRDSVLQRLPDAQKLLLDLGGVTFMDISGVHVLIASQRRARLLGSHLVLARTSSVVQRLLELTGTAAMFDVCDEGSQGPLVTTDQ